MKLNSFIMSVSAVAGMMFSPTAYAAASNPWAGTTKMHPELRHMLVGESKLDAGISLPVAVERPNQTTSAAFLCFAAEEAAPKDGSAFYDIVNDTWSLDRKQGPQAGVCFGHR